MGLRSQLIDTAEIWRPAVTVASSAAATATYKKLVDAAKVRVVDAGAGERKVQGREGVVSSHKILCSATEDVKSDDDVRIRVGTVQYVFRVNTIEDIWRVRTLHHQEAMTTLISTTGFSRTPKL